MPPFASLARRSALVLAVLAVCTLSLPGASTAQTQDAGLAAEAQFRDWLTKTVWPDAQKQGVSRETFDRNLAAITLDWSLPELLPPGRPAPSDDQRQAEFQSPGRYFAEAQLASLAKNGRDLLRRWT